jgi:hypothetical protein
VKSFQELKEIIFNNLTAYIHFNVMDENYNEAYQNFPSLENVFLNLILLPHVKLSMHGRAISK